MKRCEQCKFWEHLPEEKYPADWPPLTRPERLGLCGEPSQQSQPRALRLYGAHGLCAKFTPMQETNQ